MNRETCQAPANVSTRSAIDPRTCARAVKSGRAAGHAAPANLLICHTKSKEITR